eukprot:6029072-Prorocentrum_lima.AAC.1
MTSSLVGSEMCIRDRGKRGDLPSGSAQPNQRRAGDAEALAAPDRNDPTCQPSPAPHPLRT